MIDCILVSPLERHEESGLQAVYCRTVSGERGLLTGHAALLARLEDGSIIRLQQSEGGEIAYQLGRDSFLRFTGNQAVVISSETKSLQSVPT
jgi:F0F1-type ATP synthase epsilon subunit